MAAPPSFSSFPDFKAGPSNHTLSASKDVRREKKHNEKSKERKKRSSRHGKDTPESQDPRDKPTFDLDEIPLAKESPRLYRSDWKGDVYNIRYGGLHAGDVPKYHIIDRGRTILGLSRSWTATRRGKGIEVGPTERQKMRSLTDSGARTLLLAPATRRVQQSGDVYKYPEIDGFLRLPSSRSQDVKAESYRAITHLKDDPNSDSDASSASDASLSDDDSSNEITLTSYQEKLKSLEQGLDSDPASAETWLQLLSHTLSTIPLSSKNATRARSEITISILARAFAADARNGASKLLRIRYLKAGEEVWHQSKIRAEWEDALKIGGVEIWMEWMEWRIRQAVDGVDGLVEDAVRMMGLFGKHEHDELSKVRVFWRIAVVFQRAGFTERATAMFQAQAELTFELPQSLFGLPYETQLENLETFWESEVPRVGEIGSHGWAAWASSRCKGEASSSLAMSDTAPTVDLDPYRQWAAREACADDVHFLPSRSSDDTDDPYSTILFSDIRPLLISLTYPVAKNAFRLAWISLAGLHVPGFSLSMSNYLNDINWDDRWNLGCLTRRSYLDALFPSDAMQNKLTQDAVAGTVVGREREYADAWGPVKHWSHGVLGPLDGIGVSEKGKVKAAMWGNEDVERLDVSYIRRLFVQMRLGADDADWDILTLAFETALNVKGAIKHSRSLLSQGESLAHWGAHAQLEMIRGRLDDARKVYQTILIASKATSTQQGTSILWWNWAHMEWLNGNSAQALQVVQRSVGVEGQGGISVLRCKRGLDETIKGEQDWKDREGWVKMRALLEILAGNGISPALQIFDDHLFGERKKGPRRESLMVACLLTIYGYGMVLKNPMPLAVLRQRVEKALEEYPSNSIILGLFLEGERGQGVWGRVRGMLGESGPKIKDVIRRAEEVWVAGWDKGRWSGEIERTRSGLAGAVESERTKGSHVIWRIYIEFEIRAGELQRAKKLIFRAIRECPLDKELYLIAFGPLRSVFSGRELRDIGDMMAERGLRLRRGLDEGLEGWKGDVEEGTESDSGTDEIVDNARELRRLMPY